jgi:hypothetical protein
VADNVDTLVAEIQSVVDIDAAGALTRLNRAHRRMCARAKSYRKTVAVGNTVAGTSDYALDVIEAYTFEVGGVPYGRARQGDSFAYGLGQLTWRSPGNGGLIVAEADSSGVQGIRLIPTPDSSSAGLAITSFAAVTPPDLVAGGAASTIHVDQDFYDALVEGAVATTLRRQGEGDPAGSDQIFDGACEELRQRVARRYRGSGPSQIRVQGVNA